MARLPQVVSNIPRDLRQFVDRVREALTGAGYDRFVTAQELIDSGVASGTPGGGLAGGGSTGGTDVYGTPPAPTGLTASGALAAILVQWDDPLYSGHAHAEIWSAAENNLSNAVMVGMAPGAMFTHYVGGTATRWYWVRFVNLSGEYGPWSGTNGVSASTGTDPGYLLDLLTGQIRETQLFTELGTRINLIDADYTVPGSVAWRVYQEQLARAQALLDEASARGAAITQESTARQSADASLAATLNTVTAAVNGNAAAIQTEQTARANADSAEASERSLLAAQLRGGYAGSDLAGVTTGLIAQERALRLAQDASLAQSISMLAVGSESGMDTYQVWYFDTGGAEGWLGIGQTITQGTGHLHVVGYPVPANAATSYMERTGLSFSGGAYPAIQLRAKRAAGSGWNWKLEYQMNGSWQVGDTAATQSISVGAYATIKFDLSGNTSWMGGTITGVRLYSAATSGDLWSIDYIAVGRIGPSASTALVYAEQVARITEDTALANAIDALTATVTTNASTTLARIGAEETARADADSAFSNTVAALSADFTNYATATNAALTSESTARTSADNALSSRVDALTSSYQSADTILNAQVVAEATARANADASNASQITQVTARLNNISGATLEQKFTAQATAIGELEAEYTVKIDVDGHVSGFGLASGAQSSDFIVRADRFSIAAPSGTGVSPLIPFVVTTTPETINGELVSPGIYMDAAWIKRGTITSAQIGDAAIDDAKISDAAITTAKIGDAQITSAKIASAQIEAAHIKTAAIKTAHIADAQITDAKISGAIQSTDFVSGGSGWKIDKSGFAELNNATFRGTVVVGQGSSVNYSYVTGTKPPANADSTAAAIQSGTVITGGGITLSNGGAINSTGKTWGNTTAGFYLGWTGSGYGLDIVGAGQFRVRSSISGARLEITDNVIKVYDSSGVLRVKIGDLSA